jgi:tetratricopeptide (TPR) repeat protein
VEAEFRNLFQSALVNTRQLPLPVMQQEAESNMRTHGRRFSSVVAVIGLVVSCLYSGRVASQDDADAHFEHGVDYTERGEYDTAIVEYSEAIRLRPNFPEAYNNRGFCYHKIGNHTRAIQDYNDRNSARG